VAAVVAAGLVASVPAAGAGAAGPIAAPLAGGTATPSASWAVLAVGHLGDPLNTFWQLLSRPAAGGQWRLVTPPGVADNGGLSGTFPAGGPVTVGFEPSQALRFSPLASSTDGGAHWTAGLVPAGLAAVPDALAATPTGLVALVRAGGGTVMERSHPGTSWTTVATRRDLAAGGGGCNPSGLVALAVGLSGSPSIGATCARRGRVGVYAQEGTRWQQVGPRLAPPLAGSSARLLRLSTVGPQLVGLAETEGAGPPRLVAFWGAGSGARWTVSAPWPVPATSTLLATAVGPGAGLVALFASSGGSIPVAIAGPGAPWSRLPVAPPATATVTPSSVGGFDAFSVSGSRVSVFALAPGDAAWRRAQVIDVPVVYGSSG